MAWVRIGSLVGSTVLYGRQSILSRLRGLDQKYTEYGLCQCLAKVPLDPDFKFKRPKSVCQLGVSVKVGSLIIGNLPICCQYKA